MSYFDIFCRQEAPRKASVLAKSFTAKSFVPTRPYWARGWRTSRRPSRRSVAPSSVAPARVTPNTWQDHGPRRPRNHLSKPTMTTTTETILRLTPAWPRPWRRRPIYRDASHQVQHLRRLRSNWPSRPKRKPPQETSWGRQTLISFSTWISEVKKQQIAAAEVLQIKVDWHQIARFRSKPCFPQIRKK